RWSMPCRRLVPPPPRVFICASSPCRPPWAAVRAWKWHRCRPTDRPRQKRTLGCIRVTPDVAVKDRWSRAQAAVSQVPRLIPEPTRSGSSVDGVPRKISLPEELNQAPHSVDAQGQGPRRLLMECSNRESQSSRESGGDRG